MESMIAIDGYDYLEGLDAFRKGWIQVQDCLLYTSHLLHNVLHKFCDISDVV